MDLGTLHVEKTTGLSTGSRVADTSYPVSRPGYLTGRKSYL